MHYRLEKGYDCHEKCLHTHTPAGYAPIAENRTLEEEFRRISVRESRKDDAAADCEEVTNNGSPPVPLPLPSISAKNLVLQRCRQIEPLPFTKCYPDSLLKNCFKIGEGVYGEVFQFRNENGDTSVMKIIPIEGDQLVNGEHQKKFTEIVTEIMIAMELSGLRNSNNLQSTDTFSEVRNVRCVKGCYPDRLLDLWDLYDEDRKSENDSPEMFKEDQLYIILELANGGRDLEAFMFNNAFQAYSVIKQVSCALAVAEAALEFEHRDLHWGNVLVKNIDKDVKVRYVLDGQTLEFDSYGVLASIIDFTLSRMTLDGFYIFTDLSVDSELFCAEGDYQFEVYRLMKKRNGNKWDHFEPYTNILWMHYLLDKAVTMLRYKNTKTKLHKQYVKKLNNLKDIILKYSSCKDFVLNNYAFK